MQTREKCNEIEKNVMRIDDLGNVHDLYILYASIAYKMIHKNSMNNIIHSR